MGTSWGYKEAIEYGKVFGVFPLDIFHGLVHILRSNSMAELLHDTVPYKEAVRDPLQMEWKNDMFYVNRLFRNEDVHYKVNEII